MKWLVIVSLAFAASLAVGVAWLLLVGNRPAYHRHRTLAAYERALQQLARLMQVGTIYVIEHDRGEREGTAPFLQFVREAEEAALQAERERLRAEQERLAREAEALLRERREREERDAAERAHRDKVYEPLHSSTPKQMTVSPENVDAVLDELRRDVADANGRVIEVTWHYATKRPE